MLKYLLMLCIATTFLWANEGASKTKTLFTMEKSEYKYGIFRTFEDFCANNPDAAVDNVFLEPDEESYKIFHLVYEKGSKIKKWRRIKQGNVWGYCDEKKLYINNGGSYCEINRVNDTLSWFLSVSKKKEVIGMNASGTHGAQYGHSASVSKEVEEVVLLKHSNGKSKNLTVKLLKEFMRETPSLAREYNSLSGSKQRSKLKSYFLTCMRELGYRN